MFGLNNEAVKIGTLAFLKALRWPMAAITAFALSLILSALVHSFVPLLIVYVLAILGVFWYNYYTDALRDLERKETTNN